MKTSFLFLGFSLLVCSHIHAQNAIEPGKKYEGTVEYQKTQQHTNILEFNYPEKDLENALEDYI